MFKRITILTKKNGMSHADFLKHWQEKHVDLVLSLPGVVGYTQNVVSDRANEDAEALPVDGFAEIWFASEAAMNSALETEQWGAIVADAHEFLGWMAGYSVIENVRRQPNGTAQ